MTNAGRRFYAEETAALCARKTFKMRILHTSDWHIGKRLFDRERLPEQIEALAEIAALCDRERVDLVLVAGDVFDTYLPSAEAEEAFYHAVKRIAGERRAVVVVSGNHDDGVRLAAAAPLAGDEGIYLFGNGRNARVSSERRGVHAVAAGEGYVVIENEAGERVYVNCLPYPNEARFREEKSEENFPEKIRRWIARGEAGYAGDCPHILLSHLFAAGGTTSESERDIDLGGARAVPLSCFPAEGYVALGHLHRRQRLGSNVCYSGSLLQYSFDEADTQKSVELLTTSGREIRPERSIPLSAGKRLVRLQAVGAENAAALLSQYPDAYIELTLHLSAPLTSQETQMLREANDGLVSLIVRTSASEAAPAVYRSALSAAQLFDEYYKTKYSEAPSEELKAAFLALLGEEE